MLGLICFFGQNLLAQENAPQQVPAKKGLWITDNLPESAVWRYGATDRNPEALGVFALRFSNDGNLLAMRDQRQNIRVLNIQEERLQAIIRTQNVLDLTFSPDDKYIVSGGRVKTQVWNVMDGTFERDIDQPGFRVGRSFDPPRLTVVGKGTVQQFSWPLPSKPTMKTSGLTGRTILPAGLSDDGSIAVFHNGSSLEILDVLKDQPIEPPNKVVLRRSLISPNRHLMAELSGRTSLRIFDLRNASKYKYLLTDKRRLVTATFSNDSRFLFTSNYDHAIVIWDLATMKEVQRVEGHAARIFALEAPPRLLCLASGSKGTADRSVIFWDFRDRLFPELDDKVRFRFDRVWNELGSDDPKVSLTATNQLYRELQKDASLIDLLTERLGINSNKKDELAMRWIEDLDDRKYEVRAKATAMLRAMVDQIRPLLERELKDGSQEAKWRILEILQVDDRRPGIATAAGRRELRIVLALELLGNADAFEALKLMTQSVSNQNLVGEAKAAIGRLELQ